MTISSSVIIFATLILSVALADLNCGSGMQVCNDVTMGPTCYDPTIYSCPSGSKGSVLCGFQEHGPDGACGTICYDMVDYQCCNDQLYGAGQATPCSSTSAPTSSPISGPTSAPIGGTQCGSQSCLSGDSCCNDVTMGPTCYDPSIYTCPVGSKGPVLCGNQEHGPDGACGTICYDMVDYQCCNDQLYDAGQATPCSSNPTSLPTSSPTSAPGTQAPPTGVTTAPTAAPTCGSQTCSAGFGCCDDVTMGPTCYDMSTYTCPTGSKGPVLCGNQEHGPDGACGTICYDMVDYQCCNDQLYGAGEATPCSSNPTSAPTSAPGTQAPPTGVTTAPTAAPTCGSQSCSAGFACCDDVTMGPTCYDTSIYTCPTGSKGPVLCGNQEHGPDGACGTICYDMVDYQCCNDQLYGAGEATPCSSNPTSMPTSMPTSAPGTQAPPTGVTIAPTAAPSCDCGAGFECCDDATLGKTCYDPATYTCPTGSKGPILCGNQEHGPDGACGTTCYDMTDYKCCNDQLYGADDMSAPC